ncbi:MULTISPECIES: YtzH-like family protein [Gracilibacillus]|uniref:YtzH-like family protein n=1 Tax=Gracilibacillus TaxID=74385 RepID=UPI000826B5AF|nr:MULTISPECIES: YtzH-like family protein [Gracilibacillus]
MSLTTNHQLDLLHDLLSLQCEEGNGTISECEQISRLIRSLQQQESMQNTSLYALLATIDDYSSTGTNCSNLQQHIEKHQTVINEWLPQIKDSMH